MTLKDEVRGILLKLSQDSYKLGLHRTGLVTTDLSQATEVIMERVKEALKLEMKWCNCGEDRIWAEADQPIFKCYNCHKPLKPVRKLLTELGGKG